MAQLSDDQHQHCKDTPHCQFNNDCYFFLPCFLVFLPYEQQEWQKCVSKRHEIRSLVSVNYTLILGHYCQIQAELFPIVFNLLLNDCDLVRHFGVWNAINAEFVECTRLPCAAKVDFALNKATSVSPGLLSAIRNRSIRDHLL